MARRGGPAQLNMLIAVDKPTGCTSHDVVARVRRALGERRVGHAGTLDPLASGVMLIGIGQATRLLGMLALETKSYVATVRFGAETNTDDAEGEVVREVPCAAELFDEGFARRALAGFLGTGEQVPPAFSAISVGGVRSYKRARAGEEVALPARPIRVDAADLLFISEADDQVEWGVSFTVSKGTYIRALARDVGRAVGGAAHVAALRRTASGCVTLADCLPLDGMSAEGARMRALDPAFALGLPKLPVDREELADIACGRALHRGFDGLDGAPLALVHGGALAAIARADCGRLMMEHVFPQPIEGVRS